MDALLFGGYTLEFSSTLLSGDIWIVVIGHPTVPESLVKVTIGKWKSKVLFYITTIINISH